MKKSRYTGSQILSILKLEIDKKLIFDFYAYFKRGI